MSRREDLVAARTAQPCVVLRGLGLCGDDLDFVGRQLEFAEDQLRTERDNPITIYIVREPL